MIDGYKKPWLSFDEQLESLIKRGLLVEDKFVALNHLERIGYYRLSGYWFPFRKRLNKSDASCITFTKSISSKENTYASDEFLEGTTFKNAVDLYFFDKRLKMLAIDALEQIEISIRVDISYTLGKLNKFAYLDKSLFHPEFSQTIDPKTGLTKHHKWLDKHAQLISRSREDFVRHNRTKYGLPLPIWIACEVWDFGTLSTLFSGIKSEEQDQISLKYGINNGRVFASWLRSLNYLRNVCAHHSRLWNRNIVDQPKLPVASNLKWIQVFRENPQAQVRCYLMFFIMKHLLKYIDPKSTWPSQVNDLLKQFPNISHLGVNLKGMGVLEKLKWH
jgi:abortive infection bacteriophage resistance protein